MAWTKISKKLDSGETMYWGASAWGSSPWGGTGSLWTKQSKPTDTWTKLTKAS